MWKEAVTARHDLSPRRERERGGEEGRGRKESERDGSITSDKVLDRRKEESGEEES